MSQQGDLGARSCPSWQGIPVMGKARYRTRLTSDRPVYCDRRMNASSSSDVLADLHASATAGVPKDEAYV